MKYMPTLSTSNALKRTSMTKLLLSASLVGMLSITSGCSMFSVYKIDVPQGTPITQEQAQKLQLGMSSNQVLYLLGTPAFTDTMQIERWDYIYNFKAGTFGKREGKPDIYGNQQHLVVYFTNDKVSKIEGIESLPMR